ncbi:MAG: hypothetical protein Q8L55_15815, partial [Phycisphaerales bacterium]|nr:hypothetical protein [Phycisphaerales bacterium]
MNKRTRGLLCVAGTTMGAGAALGQTPPVYFANVGGNPCCCRTCGSGESTGGAPLIVSLPPCTNEGSTYTGYARAMQSELEVAVGVLWTPQPAHFHCGTHGGVASTTQRDLIFSGPPGAGSVPVRFTMYVDGEVNAVNSSWHAAMQLGGSLGAVATCDSAGPGSCGAGGHLTVQSNLGTAPIGSAEQLVRSVTATATANDGTGSAGARVALRYHWQRVFDLPPGYTCNSVSAGIVNNRYVGTTAVTVETPQAYLSGMHEMAGNVAAEAVAGLPAVSAPNLSAVGNNLVFSNNPDLGAISVPVLNVVLGDLTVTLNPALGAVVLPVTEVGGNVDVSGNGAATNINVGSLTSAGDVDVSNNGSATHIDVGSLTTAGDVDVSNNGAATHIDVGSLTTSGDVDVSNNGSATNINVGSLASADGDVTISNNISAAIISLPSLTTGGGSVSVGGNTSASTIDLGSLTSAGGTVNVGGNTSASTIDLGSLTSVEGSVSVGGNTAASTIDLASLQTVGGDLSITDNPAL